MTDLSDRCAERVVRSMSLGTARLLVAEIEAEAVTAERARDWRNCEDIDFHVKSGRSADGVTWIWLKCSLCGNVQATAEGGPSDLGYLSVAAQMHLERKHAELIAGKQ